MTHKFEEFQQGVILHEAIVGAFRSQGLYLSAWCDDRGISLQSARQASFGMMQGPKGKQLLSDMIAAAGEDIVSRSYRYRMQNEARRLSENSALAAA